MTQRQAAFLLLILLLTYFSTEPDSRDKDSDFKAEKTRHTESEINAPTPESCYSVSYQAPVKTWREFDVVITWSPSGNCTKPVQDQLFKEGGATFRVNGFSTHELVNGMSRYVGNGTYKVRLMTTFKTRYVMMTFLTYINSGHLQATEHAHPILKQITGSPFEFTPLKGKTPHRVHRYCKARESGIASGRWVKCGNAIPGIERCGPWQTDPAFNFDHIHGFRWLPYHCQHHQYTNDELKRCLARNGWHSIVFGGDSHMRYRAYHWATRLHGVCHSCVKTHIKMVFNKVPRIEWIFDARGTRLPLSFQNISLPYEQYLHPKVRRSKFSTPFPTDALESSLFLINYGHWLLRESTNTNFISQKLNAYAEGIHKLKQLGRKVVWINTVALPWRTDQAVVEWRENTSPSRVQFFNDQADPIMEKFGIDVVDAFQISNGRVAATHDQTHYVKRLPGNDFGGVVENAISNAIINVLCNPD